MRNSSETSMRGEYSGTDSHHASVTVLTAAVRSEQALVLTKCCEHGRHAKASSPRDDDGGWSNSSVPWPDSPCEFVELAPMNLTGASCTCNVRCLQCNTSNLDCIDLLAVPRDLAVEEFEAKIIGLKRPAVIRGGAAGLYVRLLRSHALNCFGRGGWIIVH